MEVCSSLETSLNYFSEASNEQECLNLTNKSLKLNIIPLFSVSPDLNYDCDMLIAVNEST